MQQVLKSEHKTQHWSLSARLAAVALVAVLAAMVAITLALTLGTSRSAGIGTSVPASSRPIGESQQPVHGNLSGGDGPIVVQSGHGALP